MKRRAFLKWLGLTPLAAYWAPVKFAEQRKKLRSIPVDMAYDETDMYERGDGEPRYYSSVMQNRFNHQGSSAIVKRWADQLQRETFSRLEIGGKL